VVSSELEEKHSELKKMEGMKDELAAIASKADSLQRERERYICFPLQGQN